MRHALAAVWLAIVVASAAYLTVLGLAGFPIRSDLLALLPHEERDPVLQKAKDAVSRSLGRRILLAFGDTDRGRARAAAQQASKAVEGTGLADPFDGAALHWVRPLSRRRCRNRSSRSRPGRRPRSC